MTATDEQPSEVTVTVNGEERQLDEGTTVGTLVDELSAGTRRGVAAAVNGEVVTRAAMDATELRPGDRVEVVGAVQGGSR